MSERQIQIKAAAGKASWALLHCPHCIQTMASSYLQDFRFNWSLQLRCDVCDSSWWVCRECDSLRTHLKTTAQATRHNRMKHKSSTEETKEDLARADDGVQEAMEVERVEISSEFLRRPASVAYFKDLHNGFGLEKLVHRAIARNSQPQGTCNKDDVGMFLTLAQFVATLTRTQRESLADILKQTTESTNRQAEENQRVYFDLEEKAIPVPTSKQVLRNTIWEGKYSLFENLPHPEVHEHNEHAFLLPSECIADFMAHGLNDDYQGLSAMKVDHLNMSNLATSVAERNEAWKVSTVFCTIWSDDFEPNYSKGNRGSVWIMLLTIFTRRSKGLTFNNVYPVAVGPKGSCHKFVTQKILDDIESLRLKDDDNVKKARTMFDGFFKTHVPVSVHLLAFTQDQPERRGFAGLLLGGNNCHGRWGWSVDITKIVHKVKPCEMCLENLQNPESTSDRECDTCYCWFAHPTRIGTVPNQNFPQEELSDGHVPMKELTYKSLKSAVERTHDKIVSREWDKPTAKEYLGTYCINTESQRQIIECATNCAVRKRAHEENDQEVLQAADAAAEADPDKYKRWTYPPVWDTPLSLQQSCEPVMHLLFLGIVKNIIFKIQEWCTLKNAYTNTRKSLRKMTELVEPLHLSWAKVQGYKGEKLGGWVSENFVGFSRILPWAFICLNNLEDDGPYVAPNQPLSKWTIPQMKGFLRVRRLPLNGNAKELRKRVVENKDKEIPPTAGGPVENIKKIILTLWYTLCHVMGMKTIPDPAETKATTRKLICLFLSQVANHPDANNAETNVPMWVSQYNFLSLLNLPEQIVLLGPVRNRWEGSIRGEGFLRRAKPVIQSNRKNWQKNLLLNLLRQKTLNNLRSIQDETFRHAVNNDLDDVGDGDAGDLEADDTTMAKFLSEPQSYKMYSYTRLVRDLSVEKPISCVVAVQGEQLKPDLYACYRQGSQRFVQRLHVQSHGKYLFGLYYFKCRLGEVENDPQELGEITVNDYGILLPGPSTPSVEEQETESSGDEYSVSISATYALVTASWLTLNEDATKLIMPHELMHKEF